MRQSSIRRKSSIISFDSITTRSRGNSFKKTINIMPIVTPSKMSDKTTKKRSKSPKKQDQAEEVRHLTFGEMMKFRNTKDLVNINLPDTLLSPSDIQTKDKSPKMMKNFSKKTKDKNKSSKVIVSTKLSKTDIIKEEDEFAVKTPKEDNETPISRKILKSSNEQSVSNSRMQKSSKSAQRVNRLKNNRKTGAATEFKKGETNKRKDKSVP